MNFSIHNVSTGNVLFTFFLPQTEHMIAKLEEVPGVKKFVSAHTTVCDFVDSALSAVRVPILLPAQCVYVLGLVEVFHMNLYCK